MTDDDNGHLIGQLPDGSTYAFFDKEGNLVAEGDPKAEMVNLLTPDGGSTWGFVK